MQDNNLTTWRIPVTQFGGYGAAKIHLSQLILAIREMRNRGLDTSKLAECVL